MRNENSQKEDDELEFYKEKVKTAKRAIEELNLEEPYKTNAFNTLLKRLLEEERGKKLSITKRKENFVEEELSEFNSGDIPYFDSFDKMSWKNRLLHILSWARQNHSEKGLLTSEFVKIFKERFGMAYVDSGMINKEITRRLLRTPYITRKKANQRDFRWFITPKGEEYLKKRGEK